MSPAGARFKSWNSSAGTSQTGPTSRPGCCGTAEDDLQLHEGLAGAWERRAERGWTDEVCADLAGKCLAIVERPEWPEKVRLAYESADRGQRNLAWELAPTVRVDLWEAGFSR